MSDDLVCRLRREKKKTTKVTKGHFALEVILWLCFLIPGIIYSVWRLTTRHEACPACGNANLLPKSAPMAQKFLRENLPEKLTTPQEAIRRPSKAAESAGKSLERMVGRMLKK